MLPAKRTKMMRDFWGRLETRGYSQDANIGFTVSIRSGPAGGELVEGRAAFSSEGTTPQPSVNAKQNY